MRAGLKTVLAGMAFLAAGWSLDTHAQTEITLVKNTDQTQADFILGTTETSLLLPKVAQVFRTGNFSKGYVVTKVLIGSSGTTGYWMNIHEANSDDIPTTDLGALSGPSAFVTGLNTFTRQGSNIVLEPNTDYVVVLEVLDFKKKITLKGTRVDTEETRVDNWSIANSGLVQDYDTPPHAWSSASDDFTDALNYIAWPSFRMEIKGYRHNNIPTAANGTVSATEDEAYIFTKADFNFSDEDEVDTLTAVTIVTLPEDGTLADGGEVITSDNLPKTIGRGSLTDGLFTYTPPADENGDALASFTFKVNDGTADSKNAYTMTIDVASVQDTATGEVRIVGPHIFAVPATLSVDFSGIVEPDGKEQIETTATYTWNRYEAVSGRLFDANIGTGATYTLTREDLTHFKIGVTVTFTDDEGSAEGPFDSPRVPSGAGTIGTDPVCNPPVLLGGAKLLGGARKVTVGTQEARGSFTEYGYKKADGLGLMKSRSLTTGSGNTYEIEEWTTWTVATTPLRISFDKVLNATDLEKLQVHDCTEGYKLSDAQAGSDPGTYLWLNPVADWRGIASRTLYVTEDTELPELLYARTRDDKVRLYFSEALGAAASLAKEAFTVKRTPTEGSAATLNLTGTPRIAGNLVTLTLASDMARTPAGVTVSYTKPQSGSNNAITDGFGNDADSFTDQYVANYNVRSSNGVRVENMTFSGPGPDNLYTSGEWLDVTVEFNQATTLSLIGKNSNGRQIEERYRRMGLQTAGPVLRMGRECRSAHENVHGHTGGSHAVYHSGNNTTHITFRCMISEGGPWLRVNVPPNALSSRYGNIKKTSTQRQLVYLDHPAYFRQDMTETARPTIVRGPLVTGPGADGVWKEGDAGEGKTVEISYTFSAPVRIVETPPRGKPSVHMHVGFSRRNAELVRISGNTLVFSADGGGTGASRVLVPANALKLNTGFTSGYDPFLEIALILDAQTGMPAALGHGKVEATSSGGYADPPTVSGAPAVSDAGPDSEWTEGETVEVTVTFSEAVVVDTTGGTPSIGIALGGTEAKSASYVRGTGTTDLVFSYTLAPGDGTHATISVTDDSLALNGGTIRSQTSNFDAVLAHNATTALRSAGQQGEPDAVTARFDEVPEGHNGTDPIEFELHFSEEPEDLSYKTVGGALLEVTGGSITGARRLTPQDNSGWEVSAQPSGNADLVITLPNRACDEANAVCIGGQPLAAEVAVTIPREGQEQTEPLAPFTAAFAGRVPTEHDGSTKMEFEFHLSHNPGHLGYETVRDDLFTVTGGTIERAWRRTQGDEQHMHWNLRVDPDGVGDVTIELKPTTDCAETPGVCRLADGAMLASYLKQTIKGPATLSVADATVEEAEGATLDFVVTLSRTRFGTTTVQYATSDGTATEGADYTATSGTLTFGLLQTSKTISVPVLNDEHDDTGETVTLTLSNPTPSAYVRISDGTATGTITNSDAMPRAWNARFGRTVAEQVLDAVEGRMRADRTPGVEMSLAGERIGLRTDAGGAGTPAARNRGARNRDLSIGPDGGAGTAHLAEWLRGAGIDSPAGLRTRTVGGRELLLGSSFNLTAESGGPGSGGGTVSVWGRGAASDFDGREGELTVDGEVVSAMLGTDWSRGRAMAGLFVSHSTGEGGYQAPAGAGQVSSTLTGFYPWGRYALNGRIGIWGAAGYGEGTLTLEPDGQDAIRTDLGLWMAAAGLRGVLIDGGTDGFTLAAKTDALTVETSTDAVVGLAASQAGSTRLRVGLEGALPILLDDGSVLTPSMEIGVRHDGGDAETGFGSDIGAGLAWNDTKRGISAELRGRGLLTHESEGFRERGLSGSLQWDPVEGDRGPSLSLTQTIGGTSSGGADALLARGTLAGLASNDDGADGNGDLEARRLETRFGYGFAAFDDRWTAVPMVALGLTDSARALHLGGRLFENVAPGPVFGVDLEAVRRESADVAGATHDIVFGFGWSLDAAAIVGFDMRVEFARREAANDDIEHAVGVRLDARW